MYRSVQMGSAWLSRGALWATLACASWACAEPPAVFSADRLHIVATIDGGDELHFSQRNATWVHKSWGPPTNISINGCPWDPQQQPALINGSDQSLLSSDLDLSGAVLHKIRGRGSVELGRDADGLVIRFDDPDNGPDTYEVDVQFAQRLVRKTATTKPLELKIEASIDGTDEIWFEGEKAKWIHTGGTSPTVLANGKAWDVIKDPALALQLPLAPELMDLQRASLTKVRARGIVNLEYRPGRLCLDFEDRPAGADQYELIVRVPSIGARHLVRLKADTDALLGAPLKIYRFPSAVEAYALLPGERVFDARGQCLVALEAGKYQFEVLHHSDAQTLIALKSTVMDISGPTTVNLNPRRVEPRLYGPDHRPFPLDELMLRSTRPCGAVTWKAADQPNSPAPSLLLSDGQTYTIHAFGHAGNDCAAVWTTLRSSEFAKITLKPEQWRTCSFRWTSGSPKSTDKGVILQFADGQLDVPHPEKARFFTNRRFFTVAYWLAFDADRKAVFEPRGFLLPETGTGEVVLGGALQPLASAAILEDENLGRPDARHLWWEITLADAQNFLLDPAASKIDWKPKLTTTDGHPAIISPLLEQDVKALGNLNESLIASATYHMNTDEHVSIHPEVFVRRQTARTVTHVPPYRDWNTRAYLAKVARELDLIALARAEPLAAGLRFNVSWWLNSGAVGANNSITMPFSEYLDCRDWFSHPWAIAHEMMHSFGYGHTHEMDRLDREVQQRMEEFRWHVADHPEYVPEDWDKAPG